MATVNKSSLRAEFDALKARFESLCAEGMLMATKKCGSTVHIGLDVIAEELPSVR